MKKHHHVTIEKDKYDIVIKNKNATKDTKIEVKYHFDYDITKRLEDELKKYKKDKLTKITELGKNKEISRSWSIAYPVLKDIIEKKCDIFIWIIAKRDSDSYKTSKSEICMDYYLKNNSNKSERDIESVMKEFNQKLKKIRKNSHELKKIDISKPYKTCFYFYIYSF